MPRLQDLDVQRADNVNEKPTDGVTARDFALGVAASLLAAGIWWLVSQVTAFKVPELIALALLAFVFGFTYFSLAEKTRISTRDLIGLEVFALVVVALAFLFVRYQRPTYRHVWKDSSGVDHTIDIKSNLLEEMRYHAYATEKFHCTIKKQVLRWSKHSRCLIVQLRIEELLREQYPERLVDTTWPDSVEAVHLNWLKLNLDSLSEIRLPSDAVSSVTARIDDTVPGPFPRTLGGFVLIIEIYLMPDITPQIENSPEFNLGFADLELYRRLDWDELAAEALLEQ